MLQKARRPRSVLTTSNLLSLAVIAALIVLIGFPIALVIFAAVTDVLPRPGNLGLDNFSTDSLASLFSSATAAAATNSFIAAILSALLSLVIGVGLALLAARTNIRFRRFVFLAGLAPMFMPAFVAALAWSVLAGPTGLANALLRDVGAEPFVNIYSFEGFVFVLGVYNSPYVFLMVYSALRLMNTDLEDAAVIHGAPIHSAIRKVTLSLMTPAILGSTLLAFTISIENFPVAQFIARPGGVDTLPTLIYRYMSMSPSRGNDAAAIAIVLVLAVALVVVLQRWYLSRKDFATVSGKGSKSKLVDLGKWRTPALIAAAAYFLVSVVLPVLSLIVIATYSSPYIQSISGMTQAGTFSMDRFTDVFGDRQITRAIGNSVTVSLLVAVIGTAFCFLCSYLTYRTKAPSRRWIEYLAMTPLAVPAIVLGMGLLWTWLILPVPVYGTIALLVIAFIASLLPQGFRGSSASILQFNSDLEDAAVMHGAGRTKAVVTITAPLLRTSLLATFVLLLMLSMRELTVPLFLYTTDTRLLSIVIFDAYENGQFAVAAAIGVIYTGIIGALAVASQLLDRR